MSAPGLYFGIVSLVVGALFVAFPRLIGVGINRIGRSIWQRHENDLFGKMRRGMRKTFPAFSPDYDDAKVPRVCRILGVVFLIEAVIFFILSAVRG
jgi:hypothetical protein